ncbi:phenylalanine--tRNA ligase subunit alpha, partial [bacterium]|nr:phenylalanine--tRNA ligase subunit alpha [bacterium]
MIDQIKALEDKAAKALAEATSKEHLEELRVAFLGKKGEITALSRGMKDVAAEQRKEIGQVVNAVKERIGALLDERLAVIAAKEREAELAAARVDVTLPGRRRRLGHLSPLTQVEREINRIFQSLGFVIELGPEVETPHYNFDQLNFPPDHPARDAQDTIFIDEGRLLRTHTSPVQIRVMERTRPPIRMIAPGWVYRSDTLDATHSPMFSQVEGLVVDDGIT